MASTARRSSASGAVLTADVLPAHEMQIAREAGDPQTTSEIGSQLFIRPRTVEGHLSKVFTRLGISSRRELGDALRATGVVMPVP